MRKNIAGLRLTGIICVLLFAVTVFFYQENRIRKLIILNAEIQEEAFMKKEGIDNSKVPEAEGNTEVQEQMMNSKGELDKIVGTWKNARENYYSSEIEKWVKLYKTCFSPDGKAVHYGNRNVDIGTWERLDEKTVRADFTECSYMAPGYSKQSALPSYSCTYVWDEENKVWLRAADRKTVISREVETEEGKVIMEAADFDDYDSPLYYDSDECEINDYYSFYPERDVYGVEIEKALLALADDLMEGKEVELERTELPYTLESVKTYDITGDGSRELFVYVKMCSTDTFSNSGAFYVLSKKADSGYTILAKNTDFRSGYTEILASDETELLPLVGYAGSSSWKGGCRIHLGWHDGHIVVNKRESYGFHWDCPVINIVEDYEKGIFMVYAGRNPQQGMTECYGSYISIEESLKIAEEEFEPILLPFTGYDGKKRYADKSVYNWWSPFNESWWQWGGYYPEEAEGAAGTAYWIEETEVDNPDEMLKEAVAESGLELERKAYPWTRETKANVMELMRCPVADFYYISDYYSAAYIHGEICFYEKQLSADGYEEEWVLMDIH